MDYSWRDLNPVCETRPYSQEITSHTEPSKTFDHVILFLYMSVRVFGANSDAGFILTGRNQSDCPFYVSMCVSEFST